MSSSHVFVLAIIALTFGYGLLKTWIGKRPDPVASDGEADQMMDRIDMLEERIRVLERIITDGRHDLKQEIDQL